MARFRSLDGGTPRVLLKHDVTTLEFVLRVWDICSKKLLFEGACDEVPPEQVIATLGLSPDDPDIWCAEYEAAPEQGAHLLRLMGLHYSGPGTFRVSRERSRSSARMAGDKYHLS